MFFYNIVPMHISKKGSDGMSAIKNILLLLLKLEDDQQVFTADELSKEIGVSTRQIRNYIKELRTFGYVIDGDNTKGGGYRSHSQQVKLPLRITNNELIALARIKEFVEQNPVFEEYEEVNKLYHKLTKISTLTGQEKLCSSYKLQYRHIHDYQEKEFLTYIRKAIIGNKKILLTYYSSNQQNIEDRIIHPYQIQLYKDANYIHAYCEKAKGYRLFKVVRIKRVEVIDEHFFRSSDIEKIIQSQNFGLFTENKIRLVADFSYPFNDLAKEIIIGKDQTITILSNQITRIEVTVNNETEIMGWLLGFGASVKIIEPISLKNRVINEIHQMNQMYS